MALLNYTTEISAEKSVAEITVLLAKAGAASIKTDYEDGKALAISFLINTAYGRQAFRLPANMDAVYRTLQKQRELGKVPARFVTQEQAARVGWRIVKSWLEAQLAIIETEMVSLDQVMFPYLLDRGERSVYELWTEQRLALNAGEHE